MGRAASRGGGRVLLLLLVLLLAGIAAGVYLALQPAGPSHDTPGDGGAATGTTAPAPDDAGGGRRRPRPGTGAAAAAADGAGAVIGQVRLFRTREPVGNLGLSLLLRLPEEKGGGATRLAATTDGDGLFSFPRVPAAAGWELSATREGFAPIEITGLDVAKDQTVDVGTLWLAVPVDLPVLVVDTSGAPVEGAEVAAFALGRTLPESADEWSPQLREQRTLALASAPRPSRTATTGDDGRAVVAGLMPGAYRAVASSAGFAPASRDGLLLVPGTVLAPVRFVLGPGFPLEGVVTDESGAPAPDVRVIASLRRGWLPTLDKAEGTSDADGAYRIESLAPGGYFVFAARAGRELEQVGSVTIPETSKFDVRLAAGGTLRGRVTDETGGAVAGAEVHASSAQVWAPRTARTDPEGAYELAHVPAGALDSFRVEAKGYVPFPELQGQSETVGLTVREGEVTVRDVTLRRGATAVVTVIGEGKGPLEQAAVRLHRPRFWGDREPPLTAMTDGAGRAEFTGLVAGDHFAVVVAEGWVQPDLPADLDNALGVPASLPARWRIAVPAEGTVEREARLLRGGSVSGAVVAPEGGPAAGAAVSVEGARTEFPVFSDAEGKFTVEGVPLLRNTAAAAVRSDGASGTSQRFALGAGERREGVEVRLAAPGRIVGVVRTSDGSAPQGAFVRFLAGEIRGSSESQWQRIDGAERHPVSPEGRFEIDGVPAGKVTVRADAVGLLPAATAIDVAAGRETGGVTLVLGASLEIHGRVQTEHGDPVAGVTVDAGSSSEARRESWIPGVGGDPSAQTDADGRFVLRGLSDAAFRLSVTAPGYAGRARAEARPGGGEVVLTLSAGRSISGIVKGPDGAPLAGVPVRAEPADSTTRAVNRWIQAVLTSGDGTFEVRDVAEGSYRLRVTPGWDWGRELNVQEAVREGVSAGDRDVEIVVQPGLAIEGRVADAEKRPVRSGWVNATPGEGARRSSQQRWAQVRPDGTFRVAGLSGGTYDLMAWGEFRTSGASGVAAGATEVTIEVAPAWTIRGVVYDAEGLAVPAYGVRIRREGEDSWDWPEMALLGDGAFYVGGLEEGKYDLQFSVGKLAPTVVPSVAAGRDDVVARLVEGLAIAGRVVGPGGVPVDRARIQVQSTDATAVTQVSRSARTDGDGAFRVEGLLAGPYRLYVRAGDLAPLIVSGVAAGREDLRLTLEPGTSVAGTIVDGEGSPLPQVNVMLLSPEGLWIGGGGTGDDGRFEIQRVPSSGTWTVHLSSGTRNRRESVALEQTIRSGETDAKLVWK